MQSWKVRLICVALALLPCAAAKACSCSAAVICDLIKRPILFTGEVIEGGITSLRQDPWHSPDVNHVRFRVMQSFKGLPPGTKLVDLALHYEPGMCSPIPYFAGKQFLVAPRIEAGKLVDGGCFQGRSIEYSPDDVQYVRDHFAGKISSNIQGVVYSSTSSDFRFPFALVTATLAQKEYRTKTDAGGKYRLSLPGADGYTVRADAEPYESFVQHNINVPDTGCIYDPLPLRSRNVIAGRILFSGKTKTRFMKIGLVNANQPGEPIQISHVEEDGSYRFEQVPLGEYLVELNPDGPSIYYPSANSFYPSGSEAKKALRFTIDGNPVTFTGVNFKPGRRVAFRKVTVFVQFPDGLPYSSAQVFATGVRKPKGLVTWRSFALYGRTDEQSFLAPVDQRLTFRVADWYGRKLKAQYVSTHKPGISPIIVRFVVEP